MGSCCFCSKTAEHSEQCGQVHYHEMGKHIERGFKNNSLKPNTASQNNSSCSTDTDGFLGHLPYGAGTRRELPSRR